MASHVEQIAAVSAEIEKLTAKKAELERSAAFQEYPKHISVDGVTHQAENAEHEKAILASKVEAKVEAPVQAEPEPVPAPEKPAAPAAKPKKAKIVPESKRGKR